MTEIALTRVAAALTIAGSDPSGGAGIQADLKTFTVLGVYGASVLTALTAQSTRGVAGILAVPPAFVTLQIATLADDLTIRAVKTGMLNDHATVVAVAEAIRQYELRPLVVDPVMVATSGDMLLEPDAVDAVRSELAPLADVLTPNLAEAARLLHRSNAENEAEMEVQAPRPARAWRQGRRAQGRPRRRRGGRRHLHRARRRSSATVASAHRHAQHPRHGLHVVRRARRLPSCAGRRSRARRARQNASCTMRCRRAQISRSAAASVLSIICTRCVRLRTSDRADRWCCPDASTGNQTPFAHLRVVEASATKMTNAVLRHRTSSGGSVGHRRLGAPPDLAEEPVRSIRAGFFLCGLHQFFLP